MAHDPSTFGLRASDADREATADRLRIAATEGRLDHVEYEERLSATYAAKHCAELERLTADVTPAAPPVASAPPAPPVFVRASRGTNRLAVASFVTGLVWFWWIGSFMAIVMGHVALRQIDRSKGTQGGRGMAIAGLTLGYIGAAVLALAAVFGIVA